MDNKVQFGLEQVHIAFKGNAQTETIAVLTGATTDGEITVAVTSAAIVGSPVSVIVPLASETHTTPALVASTIVNALNNNVAISKAFKASYLAGVITLTARIVAADDATLSIDITPGTTGVTVGASTNGVAGTTGYETPILIPGSIKLSLKGEGDTATLYADNIAYYTLFSNNGYKGDLETALFPNAILAEMLGWEIDSNGMLVEIADAIPKDFAILFQVEGNEKDKRYVYYDCLASRPDEEHGTKSDKNEAQTQTSALTILPTVIGDKKVVKGMLELSDTNTAAYNSFFDAVLQPAFA